jgi:hypothetical protein
MICLQGEGYEYTLPSALHVIVKVCWSYIEVIIGIRAIV